MLKVEVNPLKNDLKGARVNSGYDVHARLLCGPYRVSANFQFHLRLSMVKLRNKKTAYK